jgi:hypothetical protein
MRLPFKLLGLIILFLFAAHVASYGGAINQPVPVTPFIRTATPDTGMPGDVVTVMGDALDKKHVAEVYLTDGKRDVKVEILEQSEDSIRFRLPAKVAPGRYSLMVLTVDEPKYIEQPVYFTVKGELRPPETGN